MARVMEALNIHDLIERCKAGESVKQIAQSVGVCDRTITEHFHLAGFRVPDYLAETAARRCIPLHADHMAGESILSISRRTGISRSTILRAFERAGLDWRGRSAAQFTRMSKMDAEERRIHVARANRVARVRPIGDDEMIARAATRSRRVGKYELELIEELRRRGVECEHQFPIGVYNIDIWLNESRVAVEVYRAHPGRSLMAHIHKRTEHILNSGAHQATIQVSYPKGRLHLGPVCDQLIAFAEFCRRHHPAGGKHGVIRGHGKLASTSSHETHGRPLVARLDTCDEAASDQRAW